MKYRYAALFSQNPNGQVEVTFPDLAPHAATFGEKLPQPSDPGSIAHAPHQLVILLTVDSKITHE
ncbi:hypothetical protein [Levilactobacillus parabrevis]|uniref:hypothetical protein n=1 Tax=Levilactobacillus parabrevis TaxID=357278 RepID=UPI0021A3CC8F|nr:hypothetical protein [Levilactobacillus parabrevis]MCT4486787.1 hypothetical protein [Levilactobacillus parabrevis]MCT4491151.1 hypothetical protein [Levilactobacillus parabrevis]